ncbi:MAG: hypothetical protein J6B62_09580 [Bacteroidales bacterium]|nr:hypothetical protein [Bacteroidales bacterium]
MKKMFLMAALALMCMASCERNVVIPGAVGGESVLLNVSVPVACTKAVNVGDASEDAVHSLQVFVFRKDGALDAYASKDDAESLVLSTTTGVKDIVAVTNAPAITGITSVDELDGLVTDLKDNAPGSFVMTGRGEFGITPETSSVEIDVARRVARIYLTSVTNNFSSDAYRAEEFRIEKIYLVNASGGTGYLGDIRTGVLYNAGGLDAGRTDGNLDALLQDEEVGVPVGYGAGFAYTVPHYFYCYPNAGTLETEKKDGLRCTKLVIETTLGGRTYYYPVPIGNILANHRYNVKVSITRPGSDDPDTPVSVEDATVTVHVLPWNEGADTDITI